MPATVPANHGRRAGSARPPPRTAPEEDVAVLVVDPARMTGVLSMPEPDRFVADGEPLAIPGRDAST